MSKSCAIPRSKFPRKFKVESPVHALQLARQLIRPFKHWTTGALAIEGKDIDICNSDVEIDVKSAKAEAFCALGALQRVNTKHQYAAQEFLQQAAIEFQNITHRPSTEEDIFYVNDRGRSKETHSNVLKMFTRAIRLAKAAASGR